MDHHFNVDVAKEYGIPSALIFEYIRFWVRKNQENDRNLRDGRYWTYISRKRLGDLFPYLSEWDIRIALKTLRDEQLVMSGAYNRVPFDRTTWFTLTDKGDALCEIHHIDAETNSNGYGENHHSIERDSPMDMERFTNGYGADIQPIPFIEPIKEPVNNSSVTDTFREPLVPPRGYELSIEEQAARGGAAQIPPRDDLLAYAAQMLPAMRGDNAEELLSYRDTLPDDLIRKAINEAAGGGKPTYNYVKSILNRCIEEKVFTVADFEARQKAYKQGKKPGPKEWRPLKPGEW